METIEKDQIRALLLRNEKLEAIKMVMEKTGMDLSESKEYVDDFCLYEIIGSPPGSARLRILFCKLQSFFGYRGNIHPVR